MLESPTKKNKIDLRDYDYSNDIKNRITMSLFSLFDVEVLEEIIYSSLRFPIQELADSLDVNKEKITPVLNKFAEIGLLTHNNLQVTVDKDLRKYYEQQLAKFDEDFKPGITFLRSCLAKVPIHVLPLWYATPRMSDNIIESIIEKYLETPKSYQQYLNELHFENNVLEGIITDVFSAPDFKIRSRDLREKYDLSREEFEELMLHLEFNFVCCLSYQKVDQMWKEVVTPFYEWRQYLLFLRNNAPKTIAEDENIEISSKDPFAFINAIETYLLAIEAEDDDSTTHITAIEKAHQLRFVEGSDSAITVSEEGKHWLSMTLFDRAIALYRNPLNQYPEGFDELATDKNSRLVEKSLQRVIHSGWITFEEFFQGLIEPIGKAKPITLQSLGKGSWQYVLPSYTEEEKAFVKMVIFDRLYEAGLINKGIYCGKECFSITPFGQMSLDG